MVAEWMPNTIHSILAKRSGKDVQLKRILKFSILNRFQISRTKKHIFFCMTGKIRRCTWKSCRVGPHESIHLFD